MQNNRWKKITKIMHKGFILFFFLFFHVIIIKYNVSVTFSEIPWKHKDVNTLVVDECSLVSVSTFSFLIELLQEHAQLRKIILLGDVRQLPSIEPGNFLSDRFISLARIGNNFHRYIYGLNDNFVLRCLELEIQ